MIKAGLNPASGNTKIETLFNNQQLVSWQLATPPVTRNNSIILFGS